MVATASARILAVANSSTLSDLTKLVQVGEVAAEVVDTAVEAVAETVTLEVAAAVVQEDQEAAVEAAAAAASAEAVEAEALVKNEQN